MRLHEAIEALQNSKDHKAEIRRDDYTGVSYFIADESIFKKRPGYISEETPFTLEQHLAEDWELVEKFKVERYIALSEYHNQAKNPINYEGFKHLLRNKANRDDVFLSAIKNASINNSEGMKKHLKITIEEIEHC